MRMRKTEGSVYTEAYVREESMMNEAIKAGEVFRMRDLISYEKDKVINMDVVHNEKDEACCYGV